jgi:hypothetical protein
LLGVLQAYQVGYTSPEANAGVVQRLLDTRQQIAELLDAPSYSHYQAGRDTLAEHPAAVTTFLQGGCHVPTLHSQHLHSSQCYTCTQLHAVDCNSMHRTYCQWFNSWLPSSMCFSNHCVQTLNHVQAGLGESVADKAREEVQQLQRHSRGAARVNAYDELYLRAKAQTAEVPSPATFTCCASGTPHASAASFVLCMHQLLTLD